MALNSPELVVTLKVINRGSKVMQFNAAMQPCFCLKRSVPGGWSAITESVSLPCADGQLEWNSCGFPNVNVWSPWRCVDRGERTAEKAGRGDLVYVDAATAGHTMDLVPGSYWQGSQHMCWYASLPA